MLRVFLTTMSTNGPKSFYRMTFVYTASWVTSLVANKFHFIKAKFFILLSVHGDCG